MNADPKLSKSGPRRATASDILLDGLFTGMLGALAVAAWFFVLDISAGRAFYTPALLGAILLHGAGAATGQVLIAPLEIAAYTAFHFVSFVVVGVGFSWMMSLFERFPIVFFVLLVMFLCLMIGIFSLDAALGASLVGRLHAWTVVVANLLASAAMALYQWRRHPGAMRSVEQLWEHER